MGGTDCIALTGFHLIILPFPGLAPWALLHRAFSADNSLRLDIFILNPWIYQRPPLFKRAIDFLAAKMLVEKVHHCGPIFRSKCMAMLCIIHPEPLLGVEQSISRLSSEN